MAHSSRFLGLVVALAACKPSLSVPPDASISCNQSSDCPSGYRCDTNQCVATTGNQPPKLVVGATHRGLVGVPVDVTVIDPELDDVNLEARYQVQRDDGSWSPLTPASLAAATGLSTKRNQNGHRVTWQAVADSRVSGSPLATWSSVDAQGAVYADILEAGQARLELTPVDVHGARGEPVLTDAFIVGDTPAIATFVGLPATVSGLAVLVPDLVDAEADLLDMFVQFRASPQDPWRTADIVVGETTALASATGAGLLHPLAWDTRSAPNADPSVPQGLGNTNHRTAELRLGTRLTLGGESDFGTWSAPVSVFVQNQTPPVVVALEARRGVLTPGRSPIPISYQVADEESDPADARIGYSIDGGVTFTPCPELPVPSSEGLYGLETAPIAGGGVWHTFVWDAGSGLELPDSVIVQVEVANRLTDAPDDPVSGRIGSAQVILPATLKTAATLVGTAFTEQDVSYDNPNPVYGLVVDDFDHDDVLDVAILYFDTHFRLKTYFGASATGGVELGSLTPGNTYDLGPISSNPNALALDYVDVDGDGIRDLLYHAEHAVGWLRNLGNGGFAPAGSLGDVTDLSGGACVGDLDDDGLPDLVVTYGVYGVDPVVGVQVQLATAPGVFGPATRIPFEFSITTACATGDFDHDGHLDIAANQSAGTRFLGGDGAGHFTTIATVPSSPMFGAIRYFTADVDGDGVNDLAFIDNTTPNVGVILGGKGVPPGPTRVFSTAGNYPTSVVAVDLDDDGRLDLVTDTDVLRQTFQPGVFATGVGIDGRRYGAAFSGKAPNGLPFVGFAGLAADYFVRLEFGATQAEWPVLADSGRYRSHLSGFVYSLALADVDLDGRLDATADSFSSADVLIADGRMLEPDGSFAPGVISLARYRFGPSLWADATGDGIPDLVYKDALHVAVIDRGAVPDFTSEVFHAELAYGFPSGEQDVADGVDSLAVADLDGDGVAEIVATATGYTGSTPTTRDLLVLHPGSTALALVARIPDGQVSSVSSARRFDLADVNGDGLLDLVVGSSNPNNGSPVVPPYDQTVRVFLQGPGLTFTAGTPVAVPAGEPGVEDLKLVDVNDDGIPDLLVLDQFALSVFLGQGTNGRGDGTFAAPLSVGTESWGERLAVGDLDGDGILDVVVSSNSIGALQGDASSGLAAGSFTPKTSIASLQAYDVGLADLNGDGFVDVAASTSQGVSVILGQPQNMLAGQTRAVSATDHRPGSLYAPGWAAPTFTDAFGDPPLPTLLGYHVAREDLEGFARRVREGVGVGRNAGLVPLGRAFQVDGDVRLTQRAWPPGESLRESVERRDGTGAPSAAWVVVDLPVAPARAATDWSHTDVVVIRESTDWVRASEVPADAQTASAGASSYLPRVTAGDGTAHELVVPRRRLTVITRDADGDLSTGSGPRFVIDATGVPTVVRVLTDELGTFQAFTRHLP